VVDTNGNVKCRYYRIDENRIAPVIDADATEWNTRPFLGNTTADTILSVRNPKVTSSATTTRLSRNGCRSHGRSQVRPLASNGRTAGCPRRAKEIARRAARRTRSERSNLITGVTRRDSRASSIQSSRSLMLAASFPPPVARRRDRQRADGRIGDESWRWTCATQVKLLIPQRDRRIHAHGSARRNVGPSMFTTTARHTSGLV
jgi:hypothetical protein